MIVALGVEDRRGRCAPDFARGAGTPAGRPGPAPENVGPTRRDPPPVLFGVAADEPLFGN